MRFSRLISMIRYEIRRILWQINRRFRNSVTIQTKQGVFTLPLEIEDPISKTLYFTGQYQLDTITRAISFFRETNRFPPKGEGTVLDIGANNGAISIGMLVLGEFDKAIAVEPDPSNFSNLKHNVRQNNLVDKFICLNCAASDSKSTLEFELSESNYGDHRVRRELSGLTNKELDGESSRRVIQVESDRVDSLLENVENAFKESIAIFWVDVQGYEGYVFRGAKQLLLTGVPVVSEIWPYGILRAGMTQKIFCGIAAEIWSAYWVWRRGKFVRYPINTLDILFDELGSDGLHEDVLFTK